MTDDARDIAELKGDAANPREMDDLAREGLGLAIVEYGDLGGIVFNWRTKELVAGHQRMDRLREAGAAKWVRTGETTGYVEHPGTKERFPIRVVDWTPEKQRKANLVANNPALQGRFNDQAAAQLAALEGDLDFKAMRLDALAEQIAIAEGRFVPGEDPNAHWNGMPEYAHGDKTAWKRVVVNFADEAGYKAFAAAIGQELTDRTDSVWYPRQERNDFSATSYSDEP